LQQVTEDAQAVAIGKHTARAPKRGL
jgi:hypothetical protein